MRMMTKIAKTGGASLFLVALIFVLSACGEQQTMDQPAEDGNFYYQNRDLGFQVTLPPSFEYYQTERRGGEGYTEIIFLVPTSDTSAFEYVDGYANPLTVRVYEQGAEDYQGFQEFGEKRGKHYTFDLWQDPPQDWEEKWDAETEKGIRDSLKVK